MAKNPGFSTKALDIVIYFTLGLVGLWVLSKLYSNISKTIKQNKSDNLLSEAGTNPAANIATQLYAAMNPAGFGWLGGFDGTDEEAIFTAAAKITDLKAVADAYQTIYNSSLTTDLQKELSNTDYRKFLEIAGKVNGASTGTDPELEISTKTVEPDLPAKLLKSQTLKIKSGVSAANVRKGDNINLVIGTLKGGAIAGNPSRRVNFLKPTSGNVNFTPGSYIELVNVPGYGSARVWIYEKLLTVKI